MQFNNGLPQGSFRPVATSDLITSEKTLNLTNQYSMQMLSQTFHLGL